MGEDMDQSIQIGNCFAIADIRAFNSQCFRLTIDPRSGGALLVNVFVNLAVTITFLHPRVSLQECKQPGLP